MLYEIINVYKYKKIINTKKVCLCVIGKNENLYIQEFINYYNKLGYNHIFLYDNNDINDERFYDVIKNEKDFVSVITVEWLKCLDKIMLTIIISIYI